MVEGSRIIRVTDTIVLSDDELTETFIRASGPGGQNVNKVATAVQLRFDVEGARSLPTAVKARLKQLAGRRMTSNGVLVITADTYRTQARNRAAARNRLAELIRQAAAPVKKRRPTRPTRGAVERRLEAKKRRGATKQLRRSRPKPETD